MASVVIFVFSCIYRFTGGSFWGIDHVPRRFLLGSSSAITDIFAKKGLNQKDSNCMNQYESV